MKDCRIVTFVSFLRDLFYVVFFALHFVYLGNLYAFAQYLASTNTLPTAALRARSSYNKLNFIIFSCIRFRKLLSA